MPEVFKSKDCNMYSIKLQRSLHKLKQFEHMWYNRLGEYLIENDTKMIILTYAYLLENLSLDLKL